MSTSACAAPPPADSAAAGAAVVSCFCTVSSTLPSTLYRIKFLPVLMGLLSLDRQSLHATTPARQLHRDRATASSGQSGQCSVGEWPGTVASSRVCLCASVRVGGRPFWPWAAALRGRGPPPIQQECRRRPPRLPQNEFCLIKNPPQAPALHSPKESWPGDSGCHYALHHILRAHRHSAACRDAKRRGRRGRGRILRS